MSPITASSMKKSLRFFLFSRCSRRLCHFGCICVFLSHFFRRFRNNFLLWQSTSFFFVIVVVGTRITYTAKEKREKNFWASLFNTRTVFVSFFPFTFTNSCCVQLTTYNFSAIERWFFTRC